MSDYERYTPDQGQRTLLSNVYEGRNIHDLLDEVYSNLPKREVESLRTRLLALRKSLNFKELLPDRTSARLKKYQINDHISETLLHPGDKFERYGSSVIIEASPDIYSGLIKLSVPRQRSERVNSEGTTAPSGYVESMDLYNSLTSSSQSEEFEFRNFPAIVPAPDDRAWSNQIQIKAFEINMRRDGKPERVWLFLKQFDRKGRVRSVEIYSGVKSEDIKDQKPLLNSGVISYNYSNESRVPYSFKLEKGDGKVVQEERREGFYKMRLLKDDPNLGDALNKALEITLH